MRYFEHVMGGLFSLVMLIACGILSHAQERTATLIVANSTNTTLTKSVQNTFSLN